MARIDDIISLYNCKNFSGFDYQLKMSVNYISRYLKGYRELDFINKDHTKLREYFLNSPIFESHHSEVGNKIILCKMYNVKTLFSNYLKDVVALIPNVELRKKERKILSYYRHKLKEQNTNLISKIKDYKRQRKNSLVLRIPHDSYGINSFHLYSNSLIVPRKVFIELSRFNSDPLLPNLINGKNFKHISRGTNSRLLYDLERLPGNNDIEDNNGFSFMPKYAISHGEQDIIQIRNTNNDFEDANYLTFLKDWLNFNITFEEKVKEYANKCQFSLFAISLHSFSEEYVIKKIKQYRKRKFPDINIILDDNLNKKY